MYFAIVLKYISPDQFYRIGHNKAWIKVKNKVKGGNDRRRKQLLRFTDMNSNFNESELQINDQVFQISIFIFMFRCQSI